MGRKTMALFILLLAIVLLVGCSSTPEQAPAAKGAQEKAKEKFHVTIAAGRVGDSWFVLSHALATFINERSTWLTAEVVPTAGLMDATNLVKDDKNLQKTHITVNMHPQATFFGGDKDLHLQIGMMHFLSDLFVTLDPKIKTFKDFEGKTIAWPRVPPNTAGYCHIYDNWLKLAGVNLQSIKKMEGGTDARLTALRDGAAQIGILPIAFNYPNEYQLSPSIMELSGRGEVYFPNQGNVEQNIAWIAEACTTDPFINDKKIPPLGMVVPAGKLSKTQTEPLAYITCPIFWSASKNMPDDVVYEVTRILWEAAKKGDFGAYHTLGKGITPEFLAMSFWKTDEEIKTYFHPGAIRFYNEVGAKYERFGLGK